MAIQRYSMAEESVRMNSAGKWVLKADHEAQVKALVEQLLEALDWYNIHAHWIPEIGDKLRAKGDAAIAAARAAGLGEKEQSHE